MSQQLATINLEGPAQLPAYLQAFQSQIGKNLIVGGQQRNRIGLKGNRFRLIVNGQEEGVIDDNFLDVVIVGAAEGVSRIFYADAYDPGVKVAPTCYSKKGDVPEPDVANKQSTKCATCPQNEKGSKVTEGGVKTRACGFFKRLAIVLPSEPERVYQLDMKSMTIFGESKPALNRWSLGEYGKKLTTRGIDPSMMITRLYFDTDSSVPKVLLSPLQYLDADLASKVHTVIEGDEVKAILEITAQTVDLSGEAEAPAPAAQPEPPAAVAPAVAAPSVSKPNVAAPAQAKPAASAAAPVVTRPTVTVVSAQKAPPGTVAVTAVATPAQQVADDGDLAALLAQLEAE